MSPKELLDLANQLYPDGYLCEYYNDAGERVSGSGDTLAEFIVVELLETYDPDGTDVDQVRMALVQIRRAITDLQVVFDSLEEILISLTGVVFDENDDSIIETDS